MTSKPPSSTTPKQLDLQLTIAAEREIDGIGMGVLSNGATYLTIRGLARMCGVDHSMIVRITEQWMDDPIKPRERRIRELVRLQRSDDSICFYAVEKNGTVNHTIPDAVCMAVLEYYAFETKSGNEQAIKAYRTLARKGFRDFIYAQVGYNPTGDIDVAWKQFHDRVSLTYHSVPAGYFCVFKEIADMNVTLLQARASLGKDFIPDISVGMAWGKHWRNDNLDAVYGMRQQFQHYYPEYFPQAMSNPQKPYCYPDDALGEFRKWFREEYLPNKMPEYLSKKVRDGALSASDATAAVSAFKAKALPRPI